MRIYRIAESPTQHNRRKRREGDVGYWRDYAHFFFDKVWRDGYGITRAEAYKMIASFMGLPESQAHMSVMNPEQCNTVAKWAKNKLKELDDKYKNHWTSSEA